MEPYIYEFKTLPNLPPIPETPYKIKEPNVQEDFTTLTIHLGPDSYHRISPNYRRIYYVGNGIKKSPGHPLGNQQWVRQLPFYNAIHTMKNIEVYVHDNYSLQHLGVYRVRNIYKQMSDEGFTYFAVRLDAFP